MGWLAPDTVAGEPCLRLQAADGASAVISRWGAQLLSWRPAGGDERLFLSPKATLDGSAPIRGGVPLVFPQFANYGVLPAHGFARDRWWSQRSGWSADALTFELRDDPHTRALWPHSFACEYTVRIDGPTLAMELRITNLGETAFRFQAALHTYLRVDDLALLRIEGLAGAPYLDRTAADHLDRQYQAQLAITGEVDRIYPGAPKRILVREPLRTIEIVADGGFTDQVLWNPGPERCARIADLEPLAWRQLLCAEASCIAGPPLLPPKSVWRGTQRLTAM
jgi:glucose-6-phosphate 1-epimerase